MTEIREEKMVDGENENCRGEIVGKVVNKKNVISFDGMKGPTIRNSNLCRAAKNV